MADTRTLTEDEHKAIVADRVTRETAELTAKVTELESEKADLTRQAETAQAAAATEKARADAAVIDLENFKKTTEAEKAAVEREATRVKEAREIAKHLPEAYWSPERAKRLAAMSDEDWAGYLTDLREQAGLIKPGDSKDAGKVRETAMVGTAGGGGSDDKPTTSAVLGGLFGRKGA